MSFKRMFSGLNNIISGMVAKNCFFILLLGIAYVIISYFISRLLPEKERSLGLLLLVTLLSIPTLASLLKSKEAHGNRNPHHSYHNASLNQGFFSSNRVLFKCYILFFLGVFFGFLIASSMASSDKDSFSSMFSYQMQFLDSSGIESKESAILLVQSYEPSIERAIAIITKNSAVIISSFILSFFYGAGAVFLIALNASVFASFLVFVLRFLAQSVQQGAMITSTFMMHLIPEISGFLFAAIAGALISKAFLAGMIGSHEFRKEAKDAVLVLLLAICLIILAAFIEVFVSSVMLGKIAYNAA